MSTLAPLTSDAKRHNILPQLNGVIVLNKPSGPSSARCLTMLKHMGQKKIGHAGTLDPMASGVLLVLLGQATKLSGHLMADGGKVYSGVIRLGMTTTTWDTEGEVTSKSAWEHVCTEDVCHAIAAWCELSEQPVPPYSAAKQQGQPLYRLARKGMIVTPRFKSLKISRADTLDVRLPYVRFRVACSSGTYVRSLAHSLGMRLGCGAVLTELTREYSHPFGLDEACTLSEIVAEPSILVSRVRSIDEALPRWNKVAVSHDEARRLRHGMSISCHAMGDSKPSAVDEDCALLLDEGKPLALARRENTPAGPCWTIIRGLWSQP